MQLTTSPTLPYLEKVATQYKRVNILLHPKIHDKLRKEAFKQRKSISQLVRDCLEKVYK